MLEILFYILSLTWGLPLTLVGAGVALVLTLKGYKPKLYAYGVYYEMGERWGGLNLGLFCFTQKDAPKSTKNHEFGHALQNCLYGIFTPFIVTIPSAIRYWYRVYRQRKGLPNITPYDAIWFEKQATEWGELATIEGIDYE